MLGFVAQPTALGSAERTGNLHKQSARKGKEMARLRIFVSSTYYDLRHVRSGMEGFIESMGYESVLFESGDIPFHHDISLAEACYSEVRNSHMLVLIIGGRYGIAAEERKNKASAPEIEKMYEAYNSVTKSEYEVARTKDIPIFIFVDKGVKAEYETFKANRANTTIKYAHVDSVNIFKLLDEILLQKRNNYVKEFDKFEDIVAWLRDQWAGIFADLLSRKGQETVLKDMSSRIEELNEVTTSLKEYTESIMRKVLPDNSEKIIREREVKVHAAKLLKFKREALINHIIDTVTSETGEPILASQLFFAFKKSTSLEDFLKKAKLPDKFVHELLSKFESAANHDYLELRRGYLEEIPELIDEK